MSSDIVGHHGDGHNDFPEDIVMMNGEIARSEGMQVVHLIVDGKEISLSCIVSKLLRGCDILIGMDAIEQLGGVVIKNGAVQFLHGNHVAGVSLDMPRDPDLTIVDKDFHAEFREGRWVVSWEWNEDEPTLQNVVPQYRIPAAAKEMFEKEVEDWIEQGWLLEYGGSPPKGIIPLMAVIQANKEKVRPVMDFRELNSFISSHTAESDVCHEKLRNWRKMGSHMKLIDLRKAYLQIHVDPRLWKHQVVSFKGTLYSLTRLGFGLNVAPKILTRILRKVLSLEATIERGTDSYIDDVAVDESIVSSEAVREHLLRYGLVAKPSEPLDGARVLGLRVIQSEGKFHWKRDNKMNLSVAIQTKRDLFSLCGKLVGHFPVASWLRPACGFLKRLVKGLGWQDEMDGRIKALVDELMVRVSKEDPVQGEWCVSNSREGQIWCDASSLATGVVVRIDQVVVEDACWLRKESESDHINLSELEAVIKGVNMAIKWRLNSVDIMTDSRTVEGWLRSVVSEDHRVRTHGLGEMLVRRRLDIIRKLCEAYDLTLRVSYVPSAENLADRLTPVPKTWIVMIKEAVVCAVSSKQIEESKIHELLRTVHDSTHLGVERTLFLARQCDPRVERNDVKDVVDGCNRCRQIDPAPVSWEKGVLEVDRNWSRLSVGVTHVSEAGVRRKVPYLTIVDCGPSRFALWRRIKDESILPICEQLEQVFAERGPPEEIVLDNYSTFRSEEVGKLLQNWDVMVHYRCAYRPSGNGVVERNHRTIKRMVARTGLSVSRMVFFYNSSPRCGLDDDSIPFRRLFKYDVRIKQLFIKGSRPEKGDANNSYKVGDRVFVKPPQASCTQPWREGKVTGIVSNLSVEVDGIPRHLADVRRIVMSNDGGSSDEEGESVGGGDYVDDADDRVRTRRDVRLFPRWLDDFEIG